MNTEDKNMQMDQPPAFFVPAVPSEAVGTFSSTLTFQNPQPRKLIISDLVEIDLQDGSMTFREGYEPTKAARAFWEAMSQEYRDMLKWKAEQSR